MGGGVSSQYQTSQAFTDLNVELQKPVDGADIKTPRGVSAQEEVVRLRKLLADVAAEADMMQRQEHQQRMKDSKNKHRIKQDSAVSLGSPAVNKQLRKKFIKDLQTAKESPSKSPLTRHNSLHVEEGAHHTEEELPELTSEDQKAIGKLQSWIRVSYADMNVAVLVSDLSGFTSTTRKYGIVHFASVIVRMRQLCLPILKRRGAIYIGTEADNFIVIFPDTHQAAHAALEMQKVIKEYKESLTPERDHYKIKLNGIGVHCGQGVVVDKQGKLHGKVANIAYHIGEDLCAKTSVLFSKEVTDVVSKNPNFVKTEFKKIENPDEAEDGEIFEVSGETAALETEIVKTDDLRYLHPSLKELVSRHDPTADVKSIDEEIHTKFMNPYSALMFEFDFEHIEAEAGAEAGLRLKFLALDLIRPVLSAFDGNELEDVLWIFTDPKKAVMATMKLKSEIAKYNGTKNANEQIKISGYGIHTGEMIFIEGTDIHWGDPVNTSSKLGQDLAKDGEFLITPVVYNAIKEDAEVVQTYSFFEKMLKRSNVDFLCYLVKHKVQESTVEKTVEEGS